MDIKQVSTDCFITYSGLCMNVFSPTPEMICIEDIAHALSLECRWGGHIRRMYSVAQHSVEVAYRVPLEMQLQALLHDASEAYLKDIPSPIKAHLPDYKALENGLMMAIAERFGFAWPMYPQVKAADRRQLDVEWQMIVNGSRVGNEPGVAEYLFLSEYRKIVSFTRLNSHYSP